MLQLCWKLGLKVEQSSRLLGKQLGQLFYTVMPINLTNPALLLKATRRNLAELTKP